MRSALIALLGLTINALAMTAAHAAIVGRINVDNPLILVEVTSELDANFNDRITIQVTNNSGVAQVCQGRVGFYNLSTGSNSAFGVSAEKTITTGGPWILVETTNPRGSGLGNTLAYDSAACSAAPDPDEDGGGGTGSGGGGGGVAGEAYMSGTIGYSIDRAAQSVRLTASRVTNPSATTTTGSLELELWVGASPYTGGSYTGYKLGAARLPNNCGSNATLAPGVACTNVVLTATYDAPPPGTYSATMMLTQHNSQQCASNGNQCVIDWLNFTNPLVITADGNSPGPDTGGIEIIGGGTYGFTWTPDQARLSLDEVRNTSRTRGSGTLRLELWLTQQPYTGGPISGYRVLAEGLPGTCTRELNPGSGCVNISVERPVTSRPPAGVYYATVIVSEYDDQNCLTQDRYCISTSRASTATHTVPAADTGGGGSTGGGGGGSGDSSGDGGGGSFGWSMLLALMGAQCIRRRARVH